jgi:predicted nucleic acid-binding protein
MIVVDTSVWIDYWRNVADPRTAKLEQLLGRRRILMGDLILCELLQGVRSERQAQIVRHAVSGLPFEPMVGRDLAMRAAEHYRELRSRGITMRKTIDLLIGTFCLERGYPLLHNDRDFNPMVQHFGLMEA